MRPTAVGIRCRTPPSWSASSAPRGSARGSFVLALDDGSGWAARCWWLLRHVGHDAAGSLDMRTYVGPLSTDAGRARRRVTFRARPRDDDTIEAEEILARLGDGSR